jgi:hypothetical protein
MTMTIFGILITSDQTRHTAWRTAGPAPAWEVSWLPGRTVDRNSAITAMTLAEAASSPHLDEHHPLWPFIDGWSAELGLSRTEAIARISQPPANARQPESPGRDHDREATS